MTPTAAIVNWLKSFGFTPVPLSVPIPGDVTSGKNPAINGNDWWQRACQDLLVAGLEGSNVGVCTGTPLPGGGFLWIVDVDREEGLAQWEALCGVREYVPNTFTVQSGSGVGRHYYYRTPIACGSRKIAAKIDSRGVGGQAVAPGCEHGSGGVYCVLSGAPDALELAPQWLIDLAGTYNRPTNGPAWDGPEVQVTREQCLNAQQDIVRQLATGQPAVTRGEGQAHQWVLRVTAALVQEFTAGITDESVVALCLPTMSETVEILNALRGARSRFALSYEDWQSLQGLCGPVVPRKTEITIDDCLREAAKLGRQPSGRKYEDREIWLGLGWHKAEKQVAPEDRPRAYQLLRKAFPHATVRSVAALLRIEPAAAQLGMEAARRAAESRYGGLNVTGLQTSEGEVICNEVNMLRLIDNNLSDCLRVNVRGEVAQIGHPPWEQTSGWRTIQAERDFPAAAQWLAQASGLKAVSSYTMRIALVRTAHRNPVNLVEQMLLELPPWDGVPLLDTCWPELLGVNTEIECRMLAMFMISAVARGLCPGAKVQTKLVLVGVPELAKSAFFEEIAGEFYDNSRSNGDGKDAVLKRHMSWIVEDQEMEAHLSRKDSSANKGDVTTDRDMVRPPYAAAPRPLLRGFVEVGTINPDGVGFLFDVTGERRYWPVTVRKRVDKAAVRALAPRLWAEALWQYRAGRKCYFETTPPELRELHDEHRVVDETAEWALSVVVQAVQSSPTHLVVTNPNGGTAQCERLEGQVMGGTLIWLATAQAATLASTLCGREVSPKRAAHALKALGWHLQRDYIKGVKSRCWHRI